MGKRLRTPHFIAGIGDGNVHEGNGNSQDNDVGLRGNNNRKKHSNPDNDSHNNKRIHPQHEQNRYELRSHSHHHRTKEEESRFAARSEILQRIEDPLRKDIVSQGAAAVADSAGDLAWGGAAFHDPGGDIPDMDIGAMDIGNINGVIGGMGIGAVPGSGTGPWQVSAFAFYFLGIIVVIGIVLHFVSEFSPGSDSDPRRSDRRSTLTPSKSGRHHSGNNSRPYQYRRRQRQRRMQKLRKKKTDEWSDDEEPIQDGAGLFSMYNGNNSSSQFAPSGVQINRGSSFDDDYGSPDYPYPCDYDNEYNEYGNDYDNHNNNRNVYHQSEYYREPNSHLAAQDISHRRIGTSSTSKEPYDYYASSDPTSGSMTASHRSAFGSTAGVLPTYKSPSASKYVMPSTTTTITTSTTPTKTSSSVFRSTNTAIAMTPPRGVSPMNSYSSGGGSSRHQRQRQRKQRNDSNFSPSGSLSSPRRQSKYGNYSSSSSNSQKNKNKNGPGMNSSSDADSFHLHKHVAASSPVIPTRTTELRARLLPDSGSRFSSFASIVDDDPPNDNLDGNSLNPEDNTDRDATLDEPWARSPGNGGGGGYGDIEIFDAESTRSHSSHHSRLSNPHDELLSPSVSAYNNKSFSSFGSTQHHRNSTHQDSLLLTPGNCEETPRIGNVRHMIVVNDGSESSLDAVALLPIKGEADGIPYVPILPTIGDTRLAQPRLVTDAPPRSISLDELRLVEMETGNSKHWDVQQNTGSSSQEERTDDSIPSFAEGSDTPSEPKNRDTSQKEKYSMSDEGSDISIPSGDPRKSIIHKRQNLTMSTDAATSLQSSIDFAELHLQEVIGGGGFGQVWKATWRGTPVAVKVLTGSAQNTHIAKAILEEFKAEINLLKGMRHPNICLYMGACMTPPNRAIITELAANGSAWDSLRLPLMPPYTAADGTANGSWPLRLYLPGRHGVPPSSQGGSRSASISAPIPPRGTWPWELVKRVSCGAARGMAYLHSGHPPVLHRDLKSANLLLDESYTTKVCDFGLSRLKAQARSMTANCGTVQWMAPEVLANRRYDEKADVYSFGIIVWELLSRECPYEGMTAIQCALAVLNRDKRPEIPKWCPPGLHALIKSCIKKEPSERPSFAEIIIALDAME